MFHITSESIREQRQPRRHRALALCLMGLSLALTLALTTVSIRVTYVTDSNGASQLLLTSESDPTRLMSLSGIEAEEGDRVYYTAFGDSLATLNIERAFTVHVEADGQEIPVKMVYGTVAQALEKAGVTLGPDDYTVPAADALVGIGSTIEVHRVRYEETVEYQTIPHETEYVYTSLYFRDTDRVTTVRAGVDGQCAVTTRHRWVDGELENSIVTDVTTTVEPQDALIKTYGAGAPVSSLTGPDGTTNPPSSYSQVLTGKATGYYSRGGRGASGLGLGYGTVAVDPDVIPTFWWTCSMRPTPSLWPTAPSTSTSMSSAEPARTMPPLSCQRAGRRGLFAFWGLLCQVCIEKTSKLVRNDYFQIFGRKDYGSFYGKALEKCPRII